MTLTETRLADPPATSRKAKTVKCVIWDLDDTLWTGTLLEDKAVSLRHGVRTILETLDGRGILNSIASRNDYVSTMQVLKTLGIEEFFLYPQIGWGAKSGAVKTIAAELNIGLDTLLFVDDQQFEREEVTFALPEVRAFDALDIERLLDRDDLNPKMVTEESRYRRHRYQSDIARQAAEDAFTGPSEEFLASLDMRLTIHPAAEGDLHRAEELTVRTNQLNATGIAYSYAELDEFRRSPGQWLLIADLADKYGGYGKIGLTLVERAASVWTIRLLLMSCRVMSRGVGGIMLREIVERAHDAKVDLLADFIPTDRNRMMYVAYQFAGFRDYSTSGGRQTLRHDGTVPAPRPPYIRVDPCF
jgi:FkbH-like protein